MLTYRQTNEHGQKHVPPLSDVIMDDHMMALNSLFTILPTTVSSDFISLTTASIYRSFRVHLAFLQCLKGTFNSSAFIDFYSLAEGTALAVSPQVYQLPVGRSCLPMSTQHGAALPHRPAPPTLVVVGQARCSSHRTRDHRWPCVQFNCSLCSEQFANGTAVF